MCSFPTDIQGRSQNLRHFYPGMGLKLGVLGFSRNRGSSGVFVICIYCGLSVKINMGKTPHSAQSALMHLFYICFCVCGQRRPPILAPWLTTPLHGLGSPLYICELSYLFNKVIIIPVVFSLYRSNTSKSRQVDSSSNMKRFFVVLIIGVILFFTLVIVFTQVGRSSANSDPFLDPMANPNIRVGRGSRL